MTNAQAETKGVDLEFNVLLLDNLMLTSSYNWSDAKYTDFTDVNGNDVAGNDMGYAPDQAFAVDVDYRIDLASGGAVDFNVSYNWKDEYYTSVSNAEKTRFWPKSTSVLPEGDWLIETGLSVCVRRTGGPSGACNVDRSHSSLRTAVQAASSNPASAQPTGSRRASTVSPS